jgi:citrate lyase subunit beta / citryl-CoA lyase
MSDAKDALGLQHARTLLFVPGSRPDRFDKAARSGADALILDLEDSVPPAEKAKARTAIEREWVRIQAFDVPILVRVNPPDSEAGRADLSWLVRLAPPFGVMVPKAEAAQSLACVHQKLNGAPVLPIIESAAGYAALPNLAAAAGIVRLAIGSIDFMADTGLQCDAAESELAPLRFAVCIATRLHHLAPPVDGVTTQIDSDEALREDVRRALRFGFGGKLCIHPRQVTVVHQAMMPTEHELAWARQVIAADAGAGGCAVQVDGRMVDRPVVLQARRMLARALSDSP